MENLKQWLFVLMATLFLVTVATGCTNGDTENEDPKTQIGSTTEKSIKLSENITVLSRPSLGSVGYVPTLPDWCYLR